MQKNTVLSAKNINKSYDTFSALKNITFTLTQGEKIGLVGPNGSGKSTLLKILAESLEQDSGVVTLKKGVTVGYMPQVNESVESWKSGGEKTKAALQKVKEENPSIYLLDEPTNNLDLEGLQDLEQFVQKSSASFVIISHDRVFLDNTVSKIIEIDEHSRTLVVFDGNYSAYKAARDLRIEREWREYDDKIVKSRKLKSSMVQKADWVRKIEQKRLNNRKLDPHEKEKPNAAYLRDKEAKMGKRMRIMKERLLAHEEETEMIQRPKSDRPFHFAFEIKDRSGDKIFEFENFEVVAGKCRVGPLSVRINFGERILISGKNGSGKTTLVKALVSGKDYEGVLAVGSNVRIGYLPQVSNLKLESSVLDEFMRISSLDSDLSRENLGKFKLKDDDIKKRIAELSPGERSRLVIVSLYAQKPHCIILDEPTNHLDFAALDTLEEALKVYQGSLIVVSHDRYFIERVGFNKNFALEDGKIIIK